MGHHNVRQPKDTKVNVNGQFAELKWDSSVGSRLSGNLDNKQKFVDSECVRLMTPLTPHRTGTLKAAAVSGTVIGSGLIVQSTPYARRQYYEHKSQSYWFERMKNQSKDAILRGAQNIW